MQGAFTLCSKASGILRLDYFLKNVFKYLRNILIPKTTSLCMDLYIGIYIGGPPQNFFEERPAALFCVSEKEVELCWELIYTVFSVR